MRGPVELAPGVFGLGSDLVNWYLVEDGGRLTAIDAGMPWFAATLEADLRRLGRTVADVEAVVLTHSDSDHTGIAGRLRAAGARVLVHERDAATVRKPAPKGGDASPRHLLANAWRPLVRALVLDTVRHRGTRAQPVGDPEAFADGDVLDVPGRPVVVHTPGHTHGHCALLLADRGVVVVGDALTTHPLVTRGAGPRLLPRYVNEDNAACLASLDRLAGLGADVVLPGHGAPWTQGVASAAQQARAAGPTT